MKLHKSNNPCQYCNNYFDVNRISKMNNMFCSDECRSTYIKLHPKTKQCSYCQTKYVGKKSNKKYCSRKCYALSRRLCNEHNGCLQCGNKFWAKKCNRKESRRKTKSFIREYQRSFCCRKCYSEYIKTFSYKKKTGINKICSLCKTPFYAQQWHKTKLYCSKYCADKSRRGKENWKNSIRRSYLISTGKLNLYNGLKKGYYTSKISGTRFRYDSSYELRRMQQLDEQRIKWTKYHGIRIPYIDKTKRRRNYVPDFFIADSIIEEVKPLSMLNVNSNDLKAKAAIEFCLGNGYKYRIITEKELGIQI